MSLIQIRIPVLSDAEKQMKNDLVTIHEDMKEISRQLEQVQIQINVCTAIGYSRVHLSHLLFVLCR